MELFPPMPLQEWRDTKETLHRFCQVVGKLRLAASSRRNHWWNVPFHLTGRGITTRPMGRADGEPVFTIDLDLVDHRLRVHTLDGRAVAFPLQGQSVASFYRGTVEALATLGIEVAVAVPRPFDLPDADRRFADDTEHAAYDPVWAGRYWRVLSQVNLLLEEFAARFSGKVSPVHHFWHTFDIAHTRFSDRHVDQPPTTDPVSREAYSREVISFGFWFGDDGFPEPAFYSYTAPEPDGLAAEPLRPGAARWDSRDGSHLAVLRYDDARTADDPRATVLEFYESAYQAGARRAGWDIQRLASPGGITDPRLRRPIPPSTAPAAAPGQAAGMAGVPLPEGYHSVNPYIVVDGAERLVDFLVEVFGGVELARSLRPDGRIDHGDVRIGDSLVMLSEASQTYPARPCVHFVYVDDVDATYRAGLAAGATSIMAPADQPWGDRCGGFVDPFDNRWWVATHLRAVP